MRVEYDEQAHTFTSEERDAIERVAEQTFPEVRRVLPELPASLVLRVSASKDVLPETGENGSNSQPNVVDWQVDATRPEGVAAIARVQLRPTLFHELHHVDRAAVVDSRTLRDHIVREGLGTAFERDFAGVSPPWGAYPPEAASWAREVLALPDDAPRDVWLFEHPDGRRWIGMRAGTFIADCAMKATGKTSADLVRTPSAALLAMCPQLRPQSAPRTNEKTPP